MKVLLDTCALLALARGELPPRAAGAFGTAEDAVVSVVTAWEVAIKVSTGRLRLTRPPRTWFDGLVERHRLRALAVDAATACAAAALPPIHRDPFDRVIVSLAQAHVLVVLTSDEHIPKYAGVHALWA